MRESDAEVVVACGVPCQCQPGYVQCSQNLCCLKYKNMAAKFRKLTPGANGGDNDDEEDNDTAGYTEPMNDDDSQNGSTNSTDKVKKTSVFSHVQMDADSYRA